MRSILTYGAVAVVAFRGGYWRAHRVGRGIIGHKPIDPQPVNLPNPSAQQIESEGWSRMNMR